METRVSPVSECGIARKPPCSMLHPGGCGQSRACTSAPIPGKPCDAPRIASKAFVGCSFRVKRPACPRRRHMKCAAGFQHFPFNESEYYYVNLANLQVVSRNARPQNSPSVAQRFLVSGSLVLMRDSDRQMGPDARALVLGVGGDTLMGIASLVEDQPGSRPMALDLLWQVLQRGQEISKRDWKVLRVAIVELREQTFIGRLFFGDSETGNAVWDCDCRPSDGLWLALKSKCPMYVRKSVWDNYATRISDMIPREATATLTSMVAQESPNDNPLTNIRGDEPEPLKRLKREMGVALAEEDYLTAARIRDHPFMQLHMRILEHRKNNRVDAARSMEQELEELINSQSSPEHHDS